MLSENFLSGIGLGNFKRDFGLYQARYFEEGHYTTKEFLLAGNGYYAFNDYWQIIVETGLIGILILPFALFIVIKIIYIRFRKNSEDPLFIFFMTCLLVLSIAAFFTHVFMHKSAQIVTFLSLCYIFTPENRLFRKMYIFFIAFFAILFCFEEIRNRQRSKELSRAKELSDAGYISESIQNYEDLYIKMNNEVAFLRPYAQVLTGKNNLKMRLVILKKIQRKWTDNLLYLNIAQTYESLGLHENAEKAFLKSVNIVPNRFVPKYALYNFYMKNKNFEKASHWRKIILTMPVKVPSDHVNFIKLRVKTNNSN